MFDELQFVVGRDRRVALRKLGDAVKRELRDAINRELRDASALRELRDAINRRDFN